MIGVFVINTAEVLNYINNGPEDEIHVIASGPMPDFLRNRNLPDLPLEDDQECSSCSCEDCCGWCGCCCECDSDDEEHDDDLCPDCLEEWSECDCYMDDDEICYGCMELEEFCVCSDDDFDEDDDDCCVCGDPNCCGF